MLPEDDSIFDLAYSVVENHLDQGIVFLTVSEQLQDWAPDATEQEVREVFSEANRLMVKLKDKI